MTPKNNQQKWILITPKCINDHQNQWTFKYPSKLCEWFKKIVLYAFIGVYAKFHGKILVARNIFQSFCVNVQYVIHN